MDILKCDECEYKEPRQNGYCYMFENEPVGCLKYINANEMEEALKKTALYQWKEVGGAVDDLKKYIKEEMADLGLLIIRFFKKMFAISNNDIKL